MESGPSYFAYGSNLSSSFLEERLKDGEWLPDGWHKTGRLKGPSPVDHGTYWLDGYEFGYTLDQGSDTTGNIVPKPGARVYGVVYTISPTQLEELDQSEDVPKGDYARVAVEVNKVASRFLGPPVVKAWTYVGNPHLVTKKVCPDPEYVARLVESATQRGFPQEYVDSSLRVGEQVLVERN